MRTRALLAAVVSGVLVVGHVVSATPNARADDAARFRLALATDSGVYVANGDGSGLRRIAWMEPPTVPIAYVNAVSLGAEGTGLAYSGQGCDEAPCPAPLGQVRVMRPDGSGNRVVIKLPLFVSHAAWSPDGSYLAYVVWTPQPPCFCPGATPTVHITSRGGTTRLALGGGIDPAWSPSGHQLAFAGVDQRIRVIDLAEPARSRVVSPPQVLGSQPTWAPDGRRLAFIGRAITEGPFGPSNVWLVRPDGTGARGLPLEADTAVAWSPDGRRLALNANGRLAVANADGSGLRQLYSSDLVYPALAWVPDGSGIAFFTDDGKPHAHGGSTAVSIVTADGSARQMIIRFLSTPVGLAWMLDPESSAGR